MPAKRPRIPARDRRQQILEVAMELFARQGFKGTTTREIAARTGVNEALIFRHFSGKEDLYWAVIDEKCRRARGRRTLAEKLESGRNEDELFSTLAEDILKRNREDMSLSRLLLFSALENHRLSNRFFRTYIARYYEVLADHIRKRMERGEFRRLNPHLAARGFLGMVAYHSLIQELFGGKRFQKFNSREVGATLTDIWLHGMLPQDGRRP